MGKTKIEWATDSWNPVRARNINVLSPHAGAIGWHCEHVSEACKHCYAETMNRRLGTGLDFKPGNIDNIEIFIDEKMLLAPLSWKKPRRIFVCSMTDLFGDWVKDEWLDRMFAVMALCPQHIFQVLTKRPTRMRDYFRPHDLGLRWANFVEVYGNKRVSVDVALDWDHNNLPNVWLGVSAEDQATADERIPELLATPAAVRFVSLEPMLGPIRLRQCLYPVGEDGIIETAALDWVIVGGQSGHGARPMHPDWPRSLRDQCAAAGVPFFFKQWGTMEPVELIGDDEYAPQIVVFNRVGKKRAGRHLDGRTHDEFPANVDTVAKLERAR